MKYFIITLTLILFLYSRINAVCNDSLILMLPADARATALGEAYSSMADNSSALYYNPAGLGNVKSISANYSYMNFIFGQQYHNISGAYRYEGLGVFGLGFCYLGDEGFKLTEKTGETDILIDTSSWYLHAGYCYELSQEILIGANLKYIREGYYIEDESITSGGMGFGAGVLTKELFIKNLNLSGVIKNIGFKSDYENGTEGGMPLEFIIGGKYRFLFIEPLLSVMKKIFVTTDISINNYNRTGIRIGSEGVFSELPADLNAFLRLGLQLPAPIEDHFYSGIFSGVGIKWQNYGLDYAFNYSGLKKGIIHYMTFKIDL